ncbi:MAG TPA: hypothetical protein VM534_01575 [Thermoanaerobaculia bacterium]|nr:hypothetical protein [Thermoanaerobaculia bacterium]
MTDRTIWIFRLIALVIVLVFTILMWSLYARLAGMKQEAPPQSPPAAERSETQ